MSETSAKHRSAPGRTAVILAAGKGTRMCSELPKVLHPVAGRELLAWVVAAARDGGCGRILVIVGHEAGRVREQIKGDDLVWVTQREQLGTGHALAQAEPHAGDDSILLVLSGDVPLVSARTLDRLAAAAEAGWGAMAVAEHADPGSLGRVVAGAGGLLEKIVEAADATPDELRIRRINAGIYALPAPDVFPFLRDLDADNAKGEYYLTEALNAAAARGRPVALVELEDPAEGYGVNDRRDLARAHRELLRRHADRLMTEGVTVLDPATVTIEPGVEVGRDAVIHPGVTILGRSRVGAGTVLHQGVWVRDSRLGEGVEVHPYSVVDGAEVAAGCSVGPFARLRPGADLRAGSQVGNFVELKNTRLGEGSKANHLAYLGDATVGREANVGAGTITCNYDGFDKHRTEIGDGAFVGSDTMLVAPVAIGRGATLGAGSVITHDVPAGALAVARARQRVIPDWERRPKKTKPRPAGAGGSAGSKKA